ncbi:MAG: squalene synthase HpnC [Nitrospirota bacterium]|nr:squalene synthase HpnC [Nitrospirota bacterium]
MIPPALAPDYAHCTAIARGHYENFPVASLLIPARLRPHVCAVYAFARRADDFADEARFEGRRLERLRGWEEQFLAALNGVGPGPSGVSRNPVLRAAAHTASVFDLPAALFLDLLSAFRQDVTVRRYATFADLLDYCRRSADPVGRLVLRLFGYRDAELDRLSDAICSALQLANFWQDVAVDAAKGRIYLPVEDLHRFGVSADAVLAGGALDEAAMERFRDLLGFRIARTRALFQDGKPLCQRVGGRLGMELKAVWLGGMAILDGIEAVDCDVFRRRPAHTSAARLRMAARVLVPGGFRRAYAGGAAHD